MNTLNNKKIFVLLGSHRSGTSLAARIINQLGLPMGNDLIPGHIDNPEGFWEHRGILSETKAIEEKLDISPFKGSHLIPDDRNLLNNNRLTAHEKNLRKILKNELRNKSIFGFKDPRTLLLLPLWKKIIHDEGLEPVYVILMRNPLAVASSIASRQGLTVDHGEFIWCCHWSYAISNLDGPPDVVLNYEDWFTSPDKQIQAVCEILGEYAVSMDNARKIVNSIIKPELSHHNNDLDLNSLSDMTTAFYKELSSDVQTMDWQRTKQLAEKILKEHLLSHINDVYNSVTGRAYLIDRRLQACETELEKQKERVRQLMMQTSEVQTGDLAYVDPEIVTTDDIDFPDLTKFIKSVPGPGKKLKVCIATEDVVGPILNGGIGTTYTHLAKLLAKAGHDTNILYLNGNYCESKSIEYWVDYYRQFNIKFTVIDPNDYIIESPAPRYFRPMYALYEYLKQEHFDLVHVSEWHGSGYLSLVSKKLGLAFNNTLFCVKTSSPWLWNREYGFHTIGDISDLPRIYAEKRSVELADIVIGGSKHLLCWMIEHGYKLPEGNTYVQPNVMVPLDLDELADKRRQQYGSRIKIDEIVFFGRLEYRKGLDIFLDAIDILIKKDVKLTKIYLLGKYGERIPSYPELTIPEYVSERTKKWPVKTEIINNYNTEAALRFLLDKQRLAVMPSVIENSTLAVYETAYYGIPFIASNRGGTPELILEAHWPNVLAEAHPIDLSDKLEEVLIKGGFIAKPSFDNKRNLSIWLKFHSAVGSYLTASDKKSSDISLKQRPDISICLVVSDDHEYANEVIKRTAKHVKNRNISFVIVNDGSTRKETLEWLGEIQDRYKSKIIVDNLRGWGEQHAQNHAAEIAETELLVFLKVGALLKENYLDVLQTAAINNDADIFCCFYDELNYADLESGREESTRHAVITEDYSYGFFDHENLSPVIAIRKEAFKKTNGFNEIYKLPGAELELLSFAHLSDMNIITIPETIVWYVRDFPGEKRLNYKALPYRSIRPYIQLAPQHYSSILLTARGCTNIRTSSRSLSGTTGFSHINPEMDQNARALYSSVGRYPRLRNFGLWAYNFQTRSFQKLLVNEMKIMRKLISFWIKIFARRKKQDNFYSMNSQK